MAFTYDASEPTSRDKVRGIIGDTVTGATNTAQQYLADETLDALLTSEGSVIRASIAGVRRIIAKLARDVDRSVHGISSTRSQRVTHYQDLLKELLRQSHESIGGISVIGSSKATNAALDANTDFPSPPFSIGQDDHEHP